ncbi:hypothetical protein PIB30_030920 [Stylosanthes scabra]|uniref:Uncharacterized protein n=1 Tax=Stylosanthes scabra TaxID=79078 RepID=A0ABU6ZBF0_9FABA|nr:hypothetical protein [Stylosanthes scabra]
MSSPKEGGRRSLGEEQLEVEVMPADTDTSNLRKLNRSARWETTHHAMQIPTTTPDVPVKEAVTSTLLPKKRKTLGWQERALPEETLELHKEDTDLEQNEAVLVAEVGGGVDLPKNDVYDTLWAILDAESDNEAEEMPREWDLDSALLNWSRNEPDVGLAGPDQGLPPTEI